MTRKMVFSIYCCLQPTRPPRKINRLVQQLQSCLLILHCRLFRDHLQDAMIHISAFKLVQAIVHLYYSPQVLMKYGFLIT